MFALNSGDKIRGDASVASKVDHLIHGVVGLVYTQLANGQLADSIGDLYTAAAAVGVASVTLVNTHTVVVTINLYLTPSGGTARRMIPKDLSLQSGYALIFDGQKMTIHDTNGGLVLGSSVSDLVYSAGWDGVTTVAPSKNVVYDALLQTLLTAQGDTVYASAANVLARLAKGAADALLGMNDADTAPEYKTLKVTTAGIMTNESQPAFLAFAVLQSNVTGDNTVYTVIFANEIFDQAANFNGVSTFTAPKTGKYKFNIHIHLYGLTTNTNVVYTLVLVTSNRTYNLITDYTPFTILGSEGGWSAGALADMDAGDTAVITVGVYGTSKVVDIGAASWLSGYLVC